MLCSLQLTAFVEGLKKLSFSPNQQFRIVTVLLDPKETNDTARRFRSRYLSQYNRPGTEAGWNFLHGSDENIHALAKSVGFTYNYNEVRGEYVHPAVLTLLSPTGTVARYLYGIEYPEKNPAARPGRSLRGQGRLEPGQARFVLLPLRLFGGPLRPDRRAHHAARRRRERLGPRRIFDDSHSARQEAHPGRKHSAMTLHLLALLADPKLPRWHLRILFGCPPTPPSPRATSTGSGTSWSG